LQATPYELLTCCPYASLLYPHKLSSTARTPASPTRPFAGSPVLPLFSPGRSPTRSPLSRRQVVTCHRIACRIACRRHAGLRRWGNVTNLVRQTPKRRARGRRHPCSPIARPHHSCRGHGHPSRLARLGRSPTYRAGSDIPRPLAGPDLFLCFFYVAYASFSSLPFPIDIDYASFLLSTTSVVSR